MEDQPGRRRQHDREAVVRALEGLLHHLEEASDEVRLVGTASSLLRDIELPVADVDILVKQRGSVDDLARIASNLGGRCVSGPSLDENSWFVQYLAEFELGGVSVSFSTVEVTPAHPVPVGECIREWPWQHFDLVNVSGHWIPLVASELRLQSEVLRSRPDRWQPIGAHLATVGWDEPLLAAVEAALPGRLRPLIREAIGAPGTQASSEERP